MSRFSGTVARPHLASTVLVADSIDETRLEREFETGAPHPEGKAGES